MEMRFNYPDVSRGTYTILIILRIQNEIDFLPYNMICTENDLNVSRGTLIECIHPLLYIAHKTVSNLWKQSKK